MSLTGNYGGFVELIHCEAADTDVVYADHEGNQWIDLESMELKLDDPEAPFSPNNCPLKKEYAARVLGDFAACTDCTHSIIVTEGVIEI